MIFVDQQKSLEIYKHKMIYSKSKQELLNSADSAPGRVRMFLLNPEQHTTPHSCTRFEWNGDLADLLTFTARALKGGSGVKVTFPQDTQLCSLDEAKKNPFKNWKIWISANHSEQSAIAKYTNFAKESELKNSKSKIFKIADSIEGENGILDSWTKLIALWSWDGVIIDLSDIRAAGTQNSNGLVASGAESFLGIYQAIANYLANGSIEYLIKLLGTLNSVMRRGGYKKGIITSTMDSRSPLIEDYLNTPIIEVDGSHKKGVIVHDSAFRYPKLIDLIIESRNTESTFIEKPCSQGLGWNVCQGLILGHKATCLIWRVNLGMCEVLGIREAMRKAALNICELHTTWRDKVPELAAYYAPLELDRQVGLDVMGLANLLAIEGVSYLQFADALDVLLNGASLMISKKANEIASQLIVGYQDAVMVCDSYMLDRRLPKLDRIFTVEPAQSHAYETVDRLGKTTCRGIFAPTGRIVTRVSSSQKNKRYFHGKVETDVMVGVELHERVCDLWQTMMDRTGRSHGISQDSWCETTPENLEQLIKNRPSQTLYYQESANFNQRGFLAKTVQDVDVIEFSQPDIEVAVIETERAGECLACAG